MISFVVHLNFFRCSKIVDETQKELLPLSVFQASSSLEGEIQRGIGLVSGPDSQLVDAHAANCPSKFYINNNQRFAGLIIIQTSKKELGQSSAMSDGHHNRQQRATAGFIFFSFLPTSVHLLYYISTHHLLDWHD